VLFFRDLAIGGVGDFSLDPTRFHRRLRDNEDEQVHRGETFAQFFEDVSPDVYPFLVDPRARSAAFRAWTTAVANAFSALELADED
jgi:hypothetical protein